MSDASNDLGHKINGRVKLSILGVLIILLALLLMSSHEGPSYQGVSLHRWLERAATGDSDAKLAIRQIGTNSLPFLVYMLSSRNSRLANAFQDVMVKSRISTSRVNHAFSDQLLAYQGFQALGSIATTAIPDMIPLLSDTNTSFVAAAAIAAVGSDGTRALAASMTNQNPRIRCDIVMALGTTRERSPLVQTTLVNATTDSHYLVRWAAAGALGRIEADPRVTLPALTNAAHDTNRIVRKSALDALGGLGKAASPAIETIRQATNDTDPMIRAAALSSLSKIDKGEPPEP
jgi:hypothetical protein